MRQRWVIAPLLIIVGCGVGIYSWWQSPASTTDVDYGTQPASNVLGSETSLTAWQTSNFTTKYPASLRIRTTTEDDTKAIIGSYMLSSVNVRNTDQAGVTVGRLGNNTFQEVSAVKYRLMHPELYTPSSRSYAPAGAVVFNGIEDYETDIFWQSGDRYAAVAVTGSSARRAELEQDVQAIVSNWQWLGK